MFDSDSREINKLRIIYRPLSPELMPLLETPEVAKNTRILNKVKYSPTTLAKYSKSIEVKISLLLESVMPNTNSDLRKQVVNDVLRRLNLLLLEDRKEINDQNKAVVSNIKSLITGMRLHVKNDREQNKFLKNVLLANRTHNNSTKKVVKNGVDNMLLPQMEYPDNEEQHGGVLEFI